MRRTRAALLQRATRQCVYSSKQEDEDEEEEEEEEEEQIE